MSLLNRQAPAHTTTVRQSAGRPTASPATQTAPGFGGQYVTTRDSDLLPTEGTYVTGRSTGLISSRGSYVTSPAGAPNLTQGRYTDRG